MHQYMKHYHVRAGNHRRNAGETEAAEMNVGVAETKMTDNRKLSSELQLGS